MKVLLIETALTGHHIPYLEALANCEKDTVLTVPAKAAAFENAFVVPFEKSKNPLGYIRWLRQIKAIVKKTDPQVVHFVYGDSIYRYMGMGLRYACGKRKIAVTCHQVRHSPLRDFGLRLLGRRADALVVHTVSLKNELAQSGVQHVTHIEYPHFNPVAHIQPGEARKKLGIPDDGARVLLALGGTRRDKGLDLLLESLRDVSQPFHLIIAGKPEFFTKDYIDEHTGPFRGSVTCLLQFLTEEEMDLCLSACDTVVLPYRYSFDGASGPLSDGVAYEKQIIGSGHGSLGQIIRENHLGFTFETENTADLRSVLSRALTADWILDDVYRQYLDRMKPERFQREYAKLYADLAG